MSGADEARAELLAFAERMRRACGLRASDGAPSAEVKCVGRSWLATAHLLGRPVVGNGDASGCEDGDAGVWAYGPTPEGAAANAVGAWRASVRRRCADAERVEANARETADGYRRICAEVGA